MKVLVTGANGMLAQEVVPALAASRHEVRPLPALDITRIDDVRAEVQRFRPECVVHLAAFTNVDACEANVERAMQVNGEGAGNVATAAAEVGAAILAMSSDYVFPGGDATPRKEDDAVGPLSVYGKSKLAGERAVRAANPSHLIVRTAWLYGQGGKNFVDTILTRARAGEPLSVVDDQRGSPTWTRDLAGTLVELLAKQATGTVHATNSGSCTWFEFAIAICQVAGIQASVSRLSSKELGRPAKRPSYSVLDTQRLESLLGHGMPAWQAALERYLAQPAPVKSQGR